MHADAGSPPSDVEAVLPLRYAGQVQRKRHDARRGREAAAEPPAADDWSPSHDPRGLPCPHCAQHHGAAVVLASCDVCWTQQSWIHFHCPACGCSSHVEARSGQLTIGELDGAPGPCLIPFARHRVPGMTVQRTRSGLTVSLGGRSFAIAAAGRRGSS